MIPNISDVPLSPFVCRHARYTDRDIGTESGYYLCRLYVLLGVGIEEVRLNMGMCENLEVANICVVFLNNGI